MATLKDVANLASVSPSTASRILHGGSIRVSQATRDRVLQAAETLQYRPNLLARSLRTRVRRTIGFLVPDIENQVYAQMVAGAEDAALSQGYALLLLNSASGERRRSFIETLASDRLDGLVIADAAVEEPWIDSMRKSGRVLLFLDRRTQSDVPFLALDDAGGAALAIQHLVDLGHRQIAYLGGPPGVDIADQRRAGVTRRSRETGVEIGSDRMLTCGFGGEGVDAAVDRLLTGDHQITALAAGGSIIAFAAAKALHRRGIRIPQDVSLIGFHETNLAAYVHPGITTVEMPLQELGRRAIMNVLACVNGGVLQSEIIEHPSPRIVVRQSTAPPHNG